MINKNQQLADNIIALSYDLKSEFQYYFEVLAGLSNEYAYAEHYQLISLVQHLNN